MDWTRIRYFGKAFKRKGQPSEITCFADALARGSFPTPSPPPSRLRFSASFL